MHKTCSYGVFLSALLLCVFALLPAAPLEARPASWFDEQAAASAPGSPKIRVDLSEQLAYFYKGGKLVGVSRVSSGRSGFRTPRGNFRVLSKKRRHRSSQFGMYVDRDTNRVVRADVERDKDPRPPGTYYRGAKMNYFIRFHRGVGFHASGSVPAHPASHGCVRMPPGMARQFYRHAPVGTRVTVTR